VIVVVVVVAVVVMVVVLVVVVIMMLDGIDVVVSGLKNLGAMPSCLPFVHE
jgi:hypothetical protein